MGKKSKVGRQRRDRFYHLAKETGYRSRAAFKLIQLNRKFEFLQKARVLVDLCAAPGGWMQVAKQNMPVSSIVVGVDMWPMKPVSGCISLVEDITTEKCRLSLKKELKTWKADVILHDGAPNLGKNWLHDSYNQNCLVLSALKLATQYLREGGWFVSKVFRSKDYNSLMWVFKQMFQKVHATKPAASRNESAEIFVVCQHYLAPAKLDPKFLNPNYVFKDLENDAPVTVQSLLKSVDKTKKKADGYSDDTSVNVNKLPASMFMANDNPAMILMNAYEIILDDDEIKNHPKTTEEIKLCCSDIKVLGKKELRTLIAWWKAFRDDTRKKNEAEDPATTETSAKTENDNSSDEEKELDEVDKQVAEMMDEDRREAKRKVKKANKEKTKLQVKMSLNMRQKEDLGPTDAGDKDMFKLSEFISRKVMQKIREQKPDMLAESDDEEGVPKKKMKKVKYNVDDSYLDDSGMYYKSESSSSEDEKDAIDSDEEGLGLNKRKTKKVRFSTSEPEVRVYDPKSKFPTSKPEVRAFDPEDEASDVEEERNPLITDLDYRDVRDKRISKAKLWFDKDVFKNIEDEEDEDFELDSMTAALKNKGAQIIGQATTEPEEQPKEAAATANKTKVNKAKEKKENVVDSGDSVEGINEWDVDPAKLSSEKKRKKKEKRTLDVEGLALGAMMVNSCKAKRDIIDAGWNRYAFNDEDLPEWFAEDEKKHMRKEVVVPSELINEYTKNRQELNVRPIKKIAEAKARKKKRDVRRLEKLKKKLEGVMENQDMTEPEKARQARQMYRKLKQPKPEVKYIVAKKHTAAKRVRRPKGLKGPYKVVDPRMKKDLRANLKKEQKSKGGKKSSRGKRNKK